MILDPQRGGRGPWQLAFGERFGVDARRLDETLFASSWADVITGKRSVESALHPCAARAGVGHGSGRRPPMLVRRRGLRHGARGHGRCHGLGAARYSAGVGLQPGAPEAADTSRDGWRRYSPSRGWRSREIWDVVKNDRDFYERAEHSLGVVGLGRSVVFLDDTSTNVETEARHGWAAVHFTKDKDSRREVTTALEPVAGCLGRSGTGVNQNREPGPSWPNRPKNMWRRSSRPMISMSERRRCSQASRAQAEPDGASHAVAAMTPRLPVLLIPHGARRRQGGSVVLEGTAQHLLRT